MRLFIGGVINPVERFYGEVRKSTANRLFENIEYQEAVIEEEVVKWINSPTKMKKLAGYEWILEQFKVSCL